MPLSSSLDSSEDGVRLTVTYDGPEVAEGRIDIRLLAPAMASVAQLVDDASRVTYGTDTGVRIEVSGDFRRGSFSYLIVATALQNLQPEQVKQVLEWIGLISGGSGLTVIGVLKWLRGRKIDRVTPEGNEARITTGNQSQVVNIQVAKLVMNYPVRSDIEGIMQPLERPGITALRIGEGTRKPTMEVDREERSAFVAPPPAAEQLHDAESTTVLQLVSPVFRVGNKWQFAYPGEAAFFAPILDQKFVRRLQRREVSFSFGDLVRVRLRTVITRTEAGTLSTSREIKEVLEILSPTKQGELFG